jgi:hypothetical protein
MGIEYNQIPNLSLFNPNDGTGRQRCIRVHRLNPARQFKQEIVCKDPPLSVVWACEFFDVNKSKLTFLQVYDGVSEADIRRDAGLGEEHNLNEFEDHTFWHYLIFKDKSGVIFSDGGFAMPLERSVYLSGGATFNYRIPYKVHSYETCSEYELECRSDYHPGWVCKPLAPMANSISRMNERF